MVHETFDIDAEIMREETAHQVKLERLRAVKQVLLDPEAMAMLRRAGNIVEPQQQQPKATPSGPAKVPTDVEAADTEEGDAEEGETQIGLVRAVIAKVDKSFTVSSIGDTLRAQGANISNVAVGRVLQRLHKKYGEIKLLRKASGKVPNKYLRASLPIVGPVQAEGVNIQ